jgi:hypothetical protein
LLITAGYGSCCAPPPTTGSWLLCLVSWRGNNDVLADQPPDDNTIHRHDLSSRFRSLACSPSDPAISQLEHSILCKYSFSFCADSAWSHHASASSLSAHGRGPLPITKRIFLSTDCNRGRVHSIGQALKSTFIIVSSARRTYIMFAPSTVRFTRSILTSTRVRPAAINPTSPANLYRPLFTPKFFTNTSKMSDAKQGVHNLQR